MNCYDLILIVKCPDPTIKEKFKNHAKSNLFLFDFNQFAPLPVNHQMSSYLNGRITLKHWGSLYGPNYTEIIKETAKSIIYQMDCDNVPFAFLQKMCMLFPDVKFCLKVKKDERYILSGGILLAEYYFNYYEDKEVIKGIDNSYKIYEKVMSEINSRKYLRKFDIDKLIFILAHYMDYNQVRNRNKFLNSIFLSTNSERLKKRLKKAYPKQLRKSIIKSILLA